MAEEAAPTFRVGKRVLQTLVGVAGTAIAGTVVGFILNFDTRMTGLKGEVETLSAKLEERTQGNVQNLVEIKTIQERLRGQINANTQQIVRLQEKDSELDARVLVTLEIVEKLSAIDQRLIALENLREQLKIDQVVSRIRSLTWKVNQLSYMMIRTHPQFYADQIPKQYINEEP